MYLSSKFQRKKTHCLYLGFIVCQNVKFQLEYVSAQDWQLLSHVFNFKIL